MNLKDNIEFKPRGVLSLEFVEKSTGKVIDSYQDDNIIVLDAKRALIAGVSQPSTDSTIRKIKLGSDFGDRMTGSPSLTFVNSTKRITRSSGSWIADGFVVGDKITVRNSINNDGEYTIAEISETVLVLSPSATLIGETGTTNVFVSRGTPAEPTPPKNTYNENSMDVVFDAPYVLNVGSLNPTTATFNVTIFGDDVMDLYPSDSSKEFNSAALHTGDGRVFAYKRFPAKSISRLVDINITWSISWN